MRRFIRWSFATPLIIAAVVFAVANRQWVTVSFDPLATPPRVYAELPLWALFFAGILPGLIVGWGACWLAQGKWRRHARQAQKELARQVASNGQKGQEPRDILPLAEFQP